jgi:cytochrome c
MKRFYLAGICCSVLMICCVSAALAQEKAPQAPSKAALSGQAAETKALVEKAAASFASRGKDKTFALMSSMTGPFRKGELYVYAADLNLVILAHPANRDLVGKNWLDLKDAKGNPFAKDIQRIATSPSGSGWVEYWWMRHGEKEPTLKRAYIMRVPGEDVLVAAGYYIK